MARKACRPAPAEQRVLEPVIADCPGCGRRMRVDYYARRTVATLGGLVGLRVQVRRCHGRTCPRYHQPYRPEAEGRLALPEHEFGLDVIALVGALRYQQHRSVPEIHLDLVARGVAVCERTVTNLLDRYDELVALNLSADRRLRQVTAKQGRVVLAIDGLQPDVGHEVLWVLRDCLSGEVLLARSLLSATEAGLAGLIGSVKSALAVPVVGVVSDGQHSVRNAVAAALPGVPHQLCHFHYLRAAATPVYEMDRHAKKERKKLVRGVRPVERQVEGKDDEPSRVVRGYCAAVRSAIPDDGRPPLDASGLKLHGRLTSVHRSLGRAAKDAGRGARKKGAPGRNSRRNSGS